MSEEPNRKSYVRQSGERARVDSGLRVLPDIAGCTTYGFSGVIERHESLFAIPVIVQFAQIIHFTTGETDMKQALWLIIGTALLSGCGGSSKTSTAVEDLMTPENVTRSPVAAVFATDDERDLGDLTQSGSVFPVVSTMIRRQWGPDDSSSNLSGAAYVKSVREEEGDIVIVYVEGGEERTVTFADSDYDSGDQIFNTVVGGVNIWLDEEFGWLTDNPSTTYYTLATLGYWMEDTEADTGYSHRAYSVIGARTPLDTSLTGTATFSGTAWGDSYRSDSSSSRHRIRIRGDMNLTATFDDAMAIEGDITNIMMSPPGGSLADRALQETTSFEITGGEIANGEYTATITGMDSNAEAPLDQSVRGFQGNLFGQFYGPAAEESGGVFNAVREEDSRILGGFYGLSKDEPDDEQ